MNVVNIIKHSLTIMLLLTTVSTVSESSERDPIRDLEMIIQILQPKLTSTRTRNLAKHLTQVSKENQHHGISTQLLLAVAMRETSLLKEHYISRTKDVGLMQISPKMIKAKGYDRKRLLKDDLYSLRTGTEILVFNKRNYSKKFKHWIGVYNAGTAFNNPKRVAIAVQYHNDVLKSIKKINRISKEVADSQQFFNSKGLMYAIQK